MSAKHIVQFKPSGRGKAQCPPDPRYPNGVDVEAIPPFLESSDQMCKVPLPYPAPECGLFLVRCTECAMSVGVTAAGRPDDPKSVTIPCFARKAMPTELTIAVCRRATDPPIKGSVGGFRCLVCNAEVRPTVRTAIRIQAGEMTPMCSTCGFAAAQDAARRGTLAATATMPEAMKQVAEYDDELFAVWLSSPAAMCGHCGTKIQTREEALHHRCGPR